MYLYIHIVLCNKRGRASTHTPPTLSSVTYAHANQFEIFFFFSFSGRRHLHYRKGFLLSLHILILLVPSAVVEHVDVYTEKVHQHSNGD
jgi:hypothetical protein